jgi:hypothetical protein
VGLGLLATLVLVSFSAGRFQTLSLVASTATVLIPQGSKKVLRHTDALDKAVLEAVAQVCQLPEESFLARSISFETSPG